MDERTQRALRLFKRRGSVYIMVSALVVSLIVAALMSVVFLRLQGRSMQSGLNGVVAGALATKAGFHDPAFAIELKSDLSALTRLGQFAFLSVKDTQGHVIGTAGDADPMQPASLDSREQGAVRYGKLSAYLERCDCGRWEFMVVAPLVLQNGAPPYGVVRGHRDIELVAPFLAMMIVAIVTVVMTGAGVALGMLRTLVNQAEEAIESDRRAIAMLDTRLKDSLKDITSHSIGTMQALVAAVDARDTYTADHSLNVSDYACAIARRMGLSATQIETVERAGLLHDIGKIGVSEHALLKKGSLTTEEYESIKRHPRIGANIVEAIPFLADVVPVIRHHHERWDGSGYPDKLRGDEIPLMARILSVADALDAMTTDRSYRRALSPAKARAELSAGRGTQFDPHVADLALQLLEEGGFGSLKRTGREAMGRVPSALSFEV